MNFSDGKIYYLSQYIADGLKDQNAFSVYARFTAKKDRNLTFSPYPTNTKYMSKTDN